MMMSDDEDNDSDDNDILQQRLYNPQKNSFPLPEQ
jgi:hypothetical protein